MMKITDPEFVYRNSASTDLKATFERVRERMRAEADAAKAAKAPKPHIVPIKREASK